MEDLLPLPALLTVEVFKRNVQTQEAALALIDSLLGHFPGHQINFDLEDCDRILRVEGMEMDAERIVLIVTNGGFECSVLED